MLEVGDRIPETDVWLAPNQPRLLAELAADRPALLLFYLFDWSST